MRSALLRGRDHVEVGSFGLISEGPAAISISKGGALKTYSHIDPNEDAAGFALGAGGWLVAVADGHDGSSGAEIAIEVLLERFGPEWTDSVEPAATDEQWNEIARNAFSELNSAVLRNSAERRADAAPTTLSLALVRPGEDKILHASIGDSHVFLTPRQQHERTCDVGWQPLGHKRAYFLGYESQGPAGFCEKMVIGRETSGGTRAVVLATDGVSERAIGFPNPPATVNELVAITARSEAAALRPTELSRSFIEAAIAQQLRNRAGDNIANAVLWLE